jgi:hypothetical protein
MHLWKKLYDEALKKDMGRKKQILFIDLSDCSRRDIFSITEAAKLIKCFGRYYKVILSLNENEA